jgi:hypothetical protein
MSGSPGRPTLTSVIFDADLRHLSTGSPVLRQELDVLEGSCARCPHAPFIHGDLGRRSCLYAGCECPGFSKDRERSDVANEPDEAGTDAAPAPVIALISKSYLVLAGGGRPGRKPSNY